MAEEDDSKKAKHLPGSGIKTKRAALADYGFDGESDDDEGDESEVETKPKKQALQYDSLTKHGYKAPTVKITQDSLKETPTPATVKGSEEKQPLEDVVLTKEEKEALEKLQKDLAYDPKRDTWRRRGKIGGETPNDTWKREQKKVKMGLADVGGGMKHLAWTAGMSMQDVKLLRGSFDG